MRTNLNKHAAISTVTILALGGLAVACSSSRSDDPPTHTASQPTTKFRHTEIPATAETTAATEITRWWVYKRHDWVVIAGFDAKKSVRTVVKMRKVGEATEISSREGLFRATPSGKVLVNTLKPETRLATAQFKSDFARFRTSTAKVAYDACADAIIDEGIACAFMLTICLEEMDSPVCLTATAECANSRNKALAACSGGSGSGGCTMDMDCANGFTCEADGYCHPTCSSCPIGYSCPSGAGACELNDCGGFDCGAYGMYCDPASNACQPADPCSIDPYGAGCDPCVYDPYACDPGGGGGSGSCGGGSECW